MASWKIADAKQRFSEVIRRAEREPQLIQNRDRVVAVVLSPEEARLAVRRSAPSVRDALAEIRSLCAADDYALPAPPRADREVAFTWPKHAPRRHQRHQRAR